MSKKHPDVQDKHIMPSLSWEISPLPLSMAEFLQINIFLLFLFNFGLMRLPKLSLGATNQNNSKMQDHFESYQDISGNILCDNRINTTVRVCIMPSSPQDFGNERDCDRVLVFRFYGLDINIFISRHYINMPNATIAFDEENNSEIPLYREEIASFLHIFYMGHLVFNDISVPFTGIWDGNRFIGKVIYAQFQFEIQCWDCRSPHFYKTDQCLMFFASCVEQDMEKNHSKATFNDYFDLPSTKVDNFQYHQHISMLYENSQKLSRKRKSAMYVASKSLCCVLHLIADHLFYKYVGEGSVMKTINVMLGLINEADAIFSSTDFDGSKQGDNIGFIVGKVTIYRDKNNPNYKLFEPVMSSDEYLERFSQYDFSLFCLGVGFTVREFSGTTGTAFPSFSDSSIPGGICQARLEVNNHYLSYNTLVATFLNDGKILSRGQVLLTLVHEFGHSFGANHDSEHGCTKGEFGSYIMNKKTNLGIEPNNRKFSSCSIESMLPVIKKKGTCLVQDHQYVICGNGIPEPGEECDCGLMQNCETVDPCCTPADVVGGYDKPCTFRRSRGKVCSPRVYPCCSHQCDVLPAEANYVCNELETCQQHSVCDGHSFHCPPSLPKANGTKCNNGLHVCSQGECSVAICEHHNLSSCLCLNETDQCKLCCQQTDNGTCLPAEIFSLFNDNESIIYQETGASCLHLGTCDSVGVCRAPALQPVIQAMVFSNINEFVDYIKNSVFFISLCMFVLTFTVIVFTCSFQIDDPDYVKALRYGKMLAIFAIAEWQTKLNRKILLDIDDYFSFHIYQIIQGCEQKDFIEAVGRLKMWFPAVPTPYLSRIAKMSASERIAVKILLLQGHKMRTFAN